VVDGKTIIAISTKSPLGEKLMGKKIKDTIDVNGITHLIEEIL
jgi:transcription elongation GreA/GreB family factor